MSIPTVMGEIMPEDLGDVLIHEHLFVLCPDVERPAADGPDYEQLISDGAAELRAASAAGVDTIVDLTVIGLGRRVDLIAEVARLVPEVNVVVSTGVYTYRDLPVYFALRDMQFMADYFIRDLSVGIADTGIRAAMLKAATDHYGMTEGVEAVLKAVAAAHRATGAPITTHTPNPPEPWGLEQQRILAEAGVDLDHVIIGHSGCSRDLDYLLQVIDEGSYVGFDTFGIYRPDRPSREEMVSLVTELCQRGMSNRIVLSHDFVSYLDWLPPTRKSSLPDCRLTHIHEDILPSFLARGITQEEIRTMLVDNPRRLLKGGLN